MTEVKHPQGFTLPLLHPRTFSRAAQGGRREFQWAESWFNILVIICAPVVVTLMGVVVATTPLVLALIVTPAAVMLAMLVWLDRAEPTPGRGHSLIWGMVVVVAGALAFNSLAGLFVSYSIVAVTVAPVVEELGKAALFCFVVSRRHIESALDGAVLISWASAGFAIVEDAAIFSSVSSNGSGALSEVFVLRGILTPFAHLLFSVWVGLAIGDVVERKLTGWRASVQILISLGMAIGLHAAWNAMAVGVPQTTPRGVLLALFLALLVTTAIALVGIQRKESSQFASVLGWSANELGLRRDEIAMLSSPGAYHAFRKYLSPERRSDLADYTRTLRRFARHESYPVPVESHKLLDFEEQRRDLIQEIKHLQEALYRDDKGLIGD